MSGKKITNPSTWTGRKFLWKHVYYFLRLAKNTEKGRFFRFSSLPISLLNDWLWLSCSSSVQRLVHPSTSWDKMKSSFVTSFFNCIEHFHRKQSFVCRFGRLSSIGQLQLLLWLFRTNAAQWLGGYNHYVSFFDQTFIFVFNIIINHRMWSQKFLGSFLYVPHLYMTFAWWGHV